MPARVNGAISNSAAVQRAGHHVGEVVEILLPFAAAEIDAEAIGLDACSSMPGGVDRLLGGAGGESCAARDISSASRIFADRGNVPIADFGGDARGKVAGVEHRRVADARFAAQQPAQSLLDARCPAE